MNVSETLNKAADLIQQQGWTQGTAGWPGRSGHDGKLCLEGGILAAAGITVSERRTCPAYQAVVRYLGLPFRTTDAEFRLTEPYDYNDAPGRTAEEVIAVLRAAAVVEATKEQTAQLQEARWQPCA